MELLNPAALWLLGVVALLLLLLRRHPHERRAVANLYIWRSVDPTGLPRWITSIQSPLLPVLILCALVAALVRPIASWTARRVAVVVDLSASMAARADGSTRIDLARDAVLGFVHGLPAGSRVWLVAARALPDDLGEYAASDPALAARLAGLQPGAGPASLQDALAMVRGVSGKGFEARVFTDQHALDDTAGWVRVGSPQENIAITAMGARVLPDSPIDAQIFVEVHNFGGTTREVPLTISDAPRVVSRGVVTLRARESQTVVATVAGSSGIFTASIDVDDALALDNTRFAVLGRSRPTTVLLDGQVGEFLNAALKAHPLLNVATAAVDRKSTHADIVVCHNCTEIPEGGSAALMIAPPTHHVPSRPLRIASTMHPVMRGLSLDGLVVEAESRVAVPSSAQVLARAGDVAAIAAFESGGRRIVALQFDIDASVLPQARGFPILVANTIAWLSATAEPATVAPGEPVRWPVPPDHRAIVTPDGRTISLSSSGSGAIFRETFSPGVYRLVERGQTQAAFVVNTSTESESDLLALGPGPEGMNGRPVPTIATIHPDVSGWLALAGFALAIWDWRRSRRGFQES